MSSGYVRPTAVDRSYCRVSIGGRSSDYALVLRLMVHTVYLLTCDDREWIALVKKAVDHAGSPELFGGNGERVPLTLRERVAVANNA